MQAARVPAASCRYLVADACLGSHDDCLAPFTCSVQGLPLVLQSSSVGLRQLSWPAMQCRLAGHGDPSSHTQQSFLPEFEIDLDASVFGDRARLPHSFVILGQERMRSVTAYLMLEWGVPMVPIDTSHKNTAHRPLHQPIFQICVKLQADRNPSLAVCPRRCISLRGRIP